MKFSVFVAIVALLGLSVDAAKLSQSSVGARGDDDDETQFSKFVSKFQRSYKTKSEFNKRLSNFKKNKKIVEEQNAKNEGFELETNKLSDLSDNEYQSMFGLIAPTDDDSNNNAQFLGYEGEELAEQTVPTSVNWVTAGAVQSIRNQASCGSCYAFSALSTIESALWIKSKTTVNLSEQQVVDCSGSYGNQGCGGGWMSYVYNYVKAKKVATEAAYPYTAKKGTCKAVTGTYGVTGYVDIAKGSPSAHMAAVAKGPVAIALNAGSSVFQLYKSGVLNSSSCGTTLNHAVVIVGYGTQNGTPYWLVRNSWGTSWGESGYIKIYRSSSSGVGICGLLSKSSYPTL